MNDKSFEELIQLNKDFYEKVAKEFSQTRQNAWPGWGRVAEILSNHFRNRKEISILDLGCGNGRFYGFLSEQKFPFTINYTGLDSNEELLNEAKQKYVGVKFEKFDVIKDILSISEHYDVIVAFGLTHHIPSVSFRKKWFAKVFDLVNDDGIAFLSFWNYKNDDRFEKSVNFIKTDKYSFGQNDLENDDYFLGWNNLPDTYRYVHLYPESELQDILRPFDARSLIRFSDDGVSKDLNSYISVIL